MASIFASHGGLLSNTSPPPKTKRSRSSSDSISFNSPSIKPQKNLNELIEICVAEDPYNLSESDQEFDFVHDIISNQPFHRIYIFDFDDTIFPTSILQKNTKIWNHTELSTINEYKQCDTLYIAIKRCIDYIVNLRTDLINKYGEDNVDFVIITNASKHWINEIKTSHSSLISSLIIKLQSIISIISAKDEFESKYDDWYSEYAVIAKQDAFQQYIQSLNIKNNKIPIIHCIGDGITEYEASKLAIQELWDHDDKEKEEDMLYLLHRIQLKTNRKSKNKTFKSLNNFVNILEKTQQYLLNTDDELRAILEHQENKENNDENDSENEHDENEKYVIDYKL